MPVKPEYKVTLLGAGGVGKSALTLRIISGVFTPTYNPTVEDYYRHDTMVDGVGPCIVEILDTAGTEQFASMKQLYMSNCRSFALVYSVDDRASFDETIELYHQIVSMASSPNDVTVILVGNKCDLEDCREVEMSEGQQAAKSIMNNCPFIETSAKDGANVQTFFVKLVGLMSGHIRGSSNLMQRRPRSSTASKSALIRNSLRIGVRRTRERSNSQPDLTVYSTDSGCYTNFSIPTDLPDGLPPLAPGENARKRCSIM